MTGLWGLAHPVAWWGLWAVVPLWLGMRALHYSLTLHLNQVISSERRATALSFRGMSMNLAYGAMMQLFGMQTAWMAGRLGAGVDAQTVFAAVATWWPWAFAASYARLDRPALQKTADPPAPRRSEIVTRRGAARGPSPGRW